MKSMFVVALLCLAGLTAANDDGQWRGEGLAESQDWGQYDGYWKTWNGVTPYAYGAVYNYGGAPIGVDGRVVDTPEVANAKAAHFAAKAAATNGAWNGVAWNAPVYKSAYGVVPAYGYYGYGAAPVALTADGKYLLDTPEVAQAKAAHFAAKAAATYGAWNGAVWNGAYNWSPVQLTADGKYLKDTPEVAQAKAAHFAAKAAAVHNAW